MFRDINTLVSMHRLTFTYFLLASVSSTSLFSAAFNRITPHELRDQKI